jgi:hypothetical protein
MITARWHPILASDRAVYHNDTRCSEGAAIAVKDRRPGDGGRAPCEQCARSGPDPLPSTGPAVPETRQRCCPACQSERATNANRLRVIQNKVTKEELQCEACGTAYWYVR